MTEKDEVGVGLMASHTTESRMQVMPLVSHSAGSPESQSSRTATPWEETIFPLPTGEKSWGKTHANPCDLQKTWGPEDFTQKKEEKGGPCWVAQCNSYHISKLSWNQRTGSPFPANNLRYTENPSIPGPQNSSMWANGETLGVYPLPTCIQTPGQQGCPRLQEAAGRAERVQSIGDLDVCLKSAVLAVGSWANCRTSRRLQFSWIEWKKNCPHHKVTVRFTSWRKSLEC